MNADHPWIVATRLIFEITTYLEIGQRFWFHILGFLRFLSTKRWLNPYVDILEHSYRLLWGYGLCVSLLPILVKVMVVS